MPLHAHVPLLPFHSIYPNTKSIRHFYLCHLHICCITVKMDISQESAGQLNPQQAEIVEDLMNSFNGENLTELSPLDARRPIHAILENWEAQVGEIDRRDVARRSLPMWRQVFDRARAVDDAVAKVTEVIDDSKDALTARRNALTELKSTVDYAKVQKSLERFKENPTHNVEARDVKKRMFQKIEKFLKDNPEQVQGMLKVLNGIDSGTNEAVSKMTSNFSVCKMNS